MSVPDHDPAPEPSPSGRHTAVVRSSGRTVDIRALASLAAWTRATQGEPVFRDVCAAADVAPGAFSNGGEDVAPERLESWLTALRDRIGGDGALLAAGMASEIPPSDPAVWLQWLASPAILYRGRAARRWMTAGTGRMVVHGRGLGPAVVRYTTTEPQSRVMCLWRQARLAQRPRAWGRPPAVVRETRCLARGDDACDYVVHWQARPRWTGALVASVATAAGLVWSSSEPGVAWILPALAASMAHALEMWRVQRANRATTDAFAAAFRRAASSAPPRPGTTDAAPDAIVPPPVPEADAAASLRRDGDYWRISFASKVVLIRHSRGLSLLVHLLRNPGQEIHVSALDALSPSDGATAVASVVPADVPVGDLGDAGEVLDAQAKATYRRRLAELREELEEAETRNDLGHVERLRAELEALTDQLRQATGLGGRSRRAGSNVDRVRVAVTKRLRAAITQIEKHHPALGAHLAATIHTGFFCSYGPGDVPWQE